MTSIEHSVGGDQLYEYWIRPICNGGGLSGYTISYRAQTTTLEGREGEDRRRGRSGGLGQTGRWGRRFLTRTRELQSTVRKC